MKVQWGPFELVSFFILASFFIGHAYHKATKVNRILTWACLTLMIGIIFELSIMWWV